MFEYYKWRLANKPIGNQAIKITEKEPIKQSVWRVMLVFTITLAFTNSLASFFGTPIVVISSIMTGISFSLLLLSLLNANIKNALNTLSKVFAFLIASGLSFGGVFGTINLLINLIFTNSRHPGQISHMVGVIMWLLGLIVAPAMIVLFFRFMDGRKLFAKINRKIYFELLITILIGIILAYYPSLLVLRTLFATRLMQFVLIAITNTGMVAGIITTCWNRGVI